MLLNDVQQVKNIIILFSVAPVCGTNHTQYAKHNTTNTTNVGMSQTKKLKILQNPELLFTILFLDVHLALVQSKHWTNTEI